MRSVRHAIILAQGEQRRLQDLGYPKHALQVGDESILGRTTRLLDERGWPMTVIGPPTLRSCVALHGARLITLARPGFCVLDALANIPHLFDQRTVVLLGDVVWSRDALDRTLSCRRDLFFAGQPGPIFVGVPSAANVRELFAVGFSEYEHDLVKQLVFDAPCRKGSYDVNGPGHLRNLLSAACRFLAGDLLLAIDDWTDDIDTAADLTTKLPLLSQKVRADQ